MRRLALCGLVACTGDPAASRPACDDSDVVATVRSIADTHPGYQPRFPARTKALTDIRETRAREVGEGTPSYERLCVATMVLANGESFEIGWQIWTSSTVFGAGWGITPCFGPYDPGGVDCSLYAQGVYPGEMPP